MYAKLTSSEMVQRKGNDKKWQKCILCEHELCKNKYFVTKLFMRNSLQKNHTFLQKSAQCFSYCIHNKIPCFGLMQEGEER